jgi:hypothetical protein
LEQPVKALQLSVVQALLSLQLSGAPAVQVPAWQVSAPLHTVLSAHDVPLATAVLTQPEVGLQVSVVQTLESLQLRGVPAVQVPLWQVSAPLHTLVSAQAVPSGRAVLAQPVVTLHESVVQTLESSQLRGVPALQMPLWQVSSPLQTLPSLHAVPFSTGVLLQPKVGLQESVVQTLESLQLSGEPAAQVPLWQVSVPLQTLPSLHDVPFSTGEFAQPLIGLQESVVHTLESLQLRAVPAVQAPLWQVSAPLQTSPSAHDVPLATAVFTQPEAGLQESVVQTLPSLQLGGVPAVQVPLWQVSAPLQALPSLQAVPLATVGFEQTPAVQTSVVHGLPSAQSALTEQD